jgi:hypothetical protein
MRVGGRYQPIDQYRVDERVVGKDVNNGLGFVAIESRNHAGQRVGLAAHVDRDVGRNQHGQVAILRSVGQSDDHAVQSLTLGHSPHDPFQERLAAQLAAELAVGLR